jgi:ADP-ribose pyrophosphatase YjhB (NUDIX family)
MGILEHLHVAAAAGAPVQARAEAEALAWAGLAGDRYAAGRGYWRDARVTRDLTLVEAEVVEGLRLEPGELRRNVTTRGIRLNDLVGEAFWIGGVLCRGAQLCEPCRHLEEITGKPLLRPLVHRGGLRAAVLRGGTVRVGGAVERAEVLEGIGVVVTRRGRALLGRRLSTHGRGTWSFPGGKPRPGESPEECAVRELHEETGLRGRRARLVGETLDGFPESRLVYRTRFVAVEADGEARPAEPDKTEAWHWFDWRELPEPLFEPVASFVAR